MTLDELRDAHPDLGFAVYALEPAGLVTLEIHFDGDFRTWTGPTEIDVLAQAFPPAPPEPAQTLADVFG